MKPLTYPHRPVGIIPLMSIGKGSGTLKQSEVEGYLLNTLVQDDLQIRRQVLYLPQNRAKSPNLLWELSNRPQ